MNVLCSSQTRILVTHGIHWLPEVDIILVMNSGHLTEQGSLIDLMTHNGPFAQFLTQFLTLQQQHQHKGEGDAVGTTHTPGSGQCGDSDATPSPDKDLDSGEFYSTSYPFIAAVSLHLYSEEERIMTSMHVQPIQQINYQNTPDG